MFAGVHVPTYTSAYHCCGVPNKSLKLTEVTSLCSVSDGHANLAKGSWRMPSRSTDMLHLWGVPERLGEKAALVTSFGRAVRSWPSRPQACLLCCRLAINDLDSTCNLINSRAYFNCSKCNAGRKTSHMDGVATVATIPQMHQKLTSPPPSTQNGTSHNLTTHPTRMQTRKLTSVSHDQAKLRCWRLENGPV